MNITDEETKRFLNFVDPGYRSGMSDILSNMNAMYAPIVFVRMDTEGNDGAYHGNYIIVIGEDTASNFKVIAFDKTFTPFKEDDVEFIISYISRRFNNLKLMFSSSTMRLFAENTSVINVAISCLDDGVFISKLFYNNYAGTILFDLSENNADFSNELWNIVLSDRSNVNRMMSAYVSGKYYVSDNIKKRVQALYESLSDSDKLLLELGEEI